MSTNGSRLVVIGGGPGGYPAAFHAADLGLDVTLVDLAADPGGVCLYRGCIPSKALLHVARLVHETRSAARLGVSFAEPAIDLDALRNWKDGVVDRLTRGLGRMRAARRVKAVQGRARFVDAHTVRVARADGADEDIAFDHAIVATGSRPATVGIFPESERVLDSTGALALADVPERLLVVGGGYIGLEMGTVYAALGSRVTIVEMMPGLLPGADRDLLAVLEKRLKADVEQILVNTKVVEARAEADRIHVKFEGADGNHGADSFDRLLVSVGRRPNTEDLGLDHTAVALTERGFIEVDEQRRTGEPAIFAIGDVTGDLQLAHKATHEARVAVEAIAGMKTRYEPRAIPAVMFTDPEVAWCGLTETEAAERGIDVRVAKFPWGASGRAATLERHDGLTKILADPATERVLGVGIVGVGAGELIAEGALAIEMGATVTDLALTIHPHPTLSETLMEAAEAYHGHSPHFMQKRK